MAQQSMCDIIPHGMEVSPTRPWNGRASTKCLAFQLNKSGIRTGSLRTKLSVARKRNFQSRDKGAETASKGQGRPNSPLPGSGIFKAETKGPKRFRRWVLRLFTETTKPRPARTAGGAPRPALKCLHVHTPETANVGRFARRCESVDMPRFGRKLLAGRPGAIAFRSHGNQMKKATANGRDSPVFEIGYFRLRGFLRMQLLFELPTA